MVDDNMKILHIFKNTNEKFCDPYIDFINKNFSDKNHDFMILGLDNRVKKINRGNVRYVQQWGYIDLIKELYKADKIILHALMSPIIVIILFLQKWLLKKCYWVIWGGDLYYHENRKRNLKSDTYELLRKQVIKKLWAFITYIKGDYSLAQKWYGAKGKYYKCLMYPSNLYNKYTLEICDKPDSKHVILVGNSADSSNNHIEVFIKLEKFKDRNIEIICPLSYGNEEYRKEVILKGKAIYGDKFVPIIHFLPFHEYLKLLARVNIAIFNHNRQQGMGNIITLLGLEKKVYIREEITTWNFCIEHDLTVFSANGKFNDLFEKMDEGMKVRNVKNIEDNFSEARLIKDWKFIFDS